MIYTWLFIITIIITIIYLFFQGSNLHLMETRKASDLQNMSFPKVGTYIIDNMHHIVIISCTITMIIMVIIIVIIVWMMVIIGDFERLIMGRQGTRLEGVVCEGNINLCSSICY